MSEKREKFREMSVAEFFKRNRHIAGFSNPTRAVYQTVKELVENALDATETHGILPDISMWIELVDKEKGFIRITVQDNGIGVPPKTVPYAFGQVLFGSKYVERQTRGLFGLGVKAAVLYAQMTTGEPVVIETQPLGSDKKYVFKLRINVRKNTPEVIESKTLDGSKGSGTKVSLVIQGDWSRSKSKVLEYIRRTYTVCPYVSFHVKYPDNDGTSTLNLKRSSSKLPPPPKTMKPHPHGIDIETLRHMIEETREGTTIYSFLITKFSGTGPRSVKQFLRKVKISPKRKVHNLKKNEIVKLVHEMKEFKWRSPPSAGLSPVGEENIVTGLKTVYKPEFVSAITRRSLAYQGHPFIIEAGIAYGGEIPLSEEPIILRFANKIPLLYDEGVDVIVKAVSSVNWRLYGIQFPSQLVVLVHIAGTKIPFHGLGKEAIASVPEVENEVKLAVQEVARKLKRHISHKRKEYEAKQKRIELTKYAPVIASALSKSIGVDEEEVISLIHNLVEKKLTS